MGDSAGPANPTKPAVLIIGGLGMSIMKAGGLTDDATVCQLAGLCTASMTSNGEADSGCASQDTLAASSPTTSTATTSPPNYA